MEHDEAIRSHAAERYVLGEMPPDARDSYEEHFFTCNECAEEVLAASHLAEGVADRRSAAVVPIARGKRWSPPTAMAWAASVALAAVLAHQQFVTIPELRQQTAAPVALAAFNLTMLGSRAPAEAVIQPPSGRPYTLLVAIPPDPPAVSYEIAVLKGTEAALRVPVTAEQARDTVQVLVPAGKLRAGTYRLSIEGVSSSGQRAEITGHEFAVQ